MLERNAALSWRQLAANPCLGQPQIPPHGSWRRSERLGDFVAAQTAEISHLNCPALPLIQLAQVLKRIVQTQ